VFPETRHQRCWFPEIANVANALPKSAQPSARKVLQEITDDVDELLAFYDFSAEHWMHLRTKNPIESTVASVRLQTKVTRGSGSARPPPWPWSSS
jgi:transposase-like protein